MTLKMFHSKSLAELLNEVDNPKLIRNIDIQKIEKLKKLIEEESIDSKILTELGASLLIAANDYNAAVEYLEKAIELDKQNVDAYFWLATCFYYVFDNIDQSIKLINKALEIDPARVDCLSFMYRLIWHSTIDPKNGIEFLKEAIKHSPDWILLKIQYLLFAMSQNDLILAEDQLKQLEHLLSNSIDSRLSDDILERYYDFYIKGNAKENLNTINDLIRIVKKWRKNIDKNKI